MSILSNFFNTAQSVYNRISGNMPSNSYDIASVPQKMIETGNFKLADAVGNFAVYENTKSDKKYRYNLTFSSEKLKQMYSFYRTADKQTVDEVRKRFQKMEPMLNLAAKEEVLKVLIGEAHANEFWRAEHIAASTDFAEYFPLVAAGDGGGLNERCQPETFTPLQIALRKCRKKAVQALVEAGADPSICDSSKNTAFHHAAIVGSKCAEAVALLKDHGSTRTCIDATNGGGCTALFLAVEGGSESMTSALIGCGADPAVHCNGTSTLREAMRRGTERHNRCLKPLLSACPSLALERDPDSGDTPLHLAMDKDKLKYLIECAGSGLNVDVRNLSNQTPLHLAASKDIVSVAVYLMANGASPDARDDTGNTPVHLAVKARQLKMLQTLLIFYPDVNQANLDGVTARHMLSQVPAEMRGEFEAALEMIGATIFSFCQTGALKHVESLMQEGAGSATNGDGLPRLVNLLSLDGGGIRGLILVQILLFIESRLGAQIANKFHWVAGTSTGALLAIALVTEKSLKDCQRLYFRFKDDVFKGLSRPYDTAILESFIKQEFTTDAKMTDVKRHRLMVTTVRADKNPTKLELFRNYSLPLRDNQLKEDLGFHDPNKLYLWKVARCSSAAPSYFATVDGMYVDGGLIANNPTLDLLSDVHLYNSALRFQSKAAETVEIGCVLSVGTGRIPDMPINSGLDIGMPDNLLDVVLKSFAVKDLGLLLIDQVTATEGAPVDRARSWCHSMATPFFRFCTPMSLDVAMDERSDEVLVQMCWETVVYMHEHRADVAQLCRLLNLWP